MTAKHPSTRNHRGTHKWLGAGAITLGIGAAAIAGGAGVAEAKTGNPDGSAGSTHSAAADKPSASAPKKAHGPKPSAAVHTPTATAASAPSSSTATATPEPKVAHAVASVTSGAPAATPPAASSAATVHAIVPVAATAAVAVNPVARVTPTAASAAAVPAATTTVTNPIAALVAAIQKALLSFQNTLLTFRTTYFNTPPKIVVGTSTKNSDGTYTGQLVVSDADGDPLAVYVTSPSTWGTTTLQAVNANTYTYTYTPSATAPIAAGYSDNLYFSVEETNALSHYHGLGQYIEYLTDEVLHSGPMGGFLYPISAYQAGTTTRNLVITVDPETTTTT